MNGPMFRQWSLLANSGGAFAAPAGCAHVQKPSPIAAKMSAIFFTRPPFDGPEFVPTRVGSEKSVAC
jgi:hypothetical protein